MPNNDVVDLFKSEQGEDMYACPICGYLGCGSAYAMMEGRKYAICSHDLCPDCFVQYGFEDMVLENLPPGSTLNTWNELRTKWLDELGWPEWAIKRIHNNLGIDVSGSKPIQ